MQARSKFLISLMVLMYLSSSDDAGAAIGDHQWSSGYAAAGRVSVDGGGNVVIHGSFFGPVDFGGGTLNPVNFFDGDQYLARFDAAGNHLWSVQFSPDGFGVDGEVVTVDSAGNIFIAGKTFNGTTVDYGGGPVAENEIYVAKFDANGVFQWSDSFGTGTVKGLAADNNHVVLSGYTSAGVDFGGGLVGTTGGTDIFVAQLTAAAGGHSWSVGLGDTGDQGGMDVAIDGAGNVVVVGSMFGSVDFGGGPLAANGLDLFLVSFSSIGGHNWSTVFDGTFTPGGGILVETAIDASVSGDIAIAGEKSSAVDFGGGSLGQIGFGDAYLAVFDNTGSHQWSSCFGSSGATDGADGVAFDSAGNVVVTGTFGDDADFGGGTIALNGNPLDGDYNLFVALYEPAGTHLFSSGYGQKVYDSGCEIGGSSMIVFGVGGSAIDLGGGAISPYEIFLGRLDGPGGGASPVEDVPLMNSALSGYPNPFNPLTTIEYVLDAPATASVAAYDARGRLVQELVAPSPHDAGLHQVRFSPRASGVYLVKLRVAGQDRIMKMVAVK